MVDPQAAPSFIWKFSGGIDNQSREYELPDKTLRKCINLDVTRGGGLRVRDGLRELQSGTFRSLFSPSSHAFGLVANGGSLYRVSTGGELTVLASVGSGRIAYTEHNGEVYWSDGATQGRVTASGSASFWGMATPPAPICTVSGELYTKEWGTDPGQIRVTMTARYLGVESGASEIVTVPGTQVSVTTPSAAGGIDFVIYTTDSVGTEFFQAAILPANTVAYPLVNYAQGKTLESLYASRPPAGSLLASGHGRIWIADGSTLWWTAALSPHWVFRARNFFQFDAAITLVAPVVDGIYVATASTTWFLGGTDPGEMSLRKVSTHGAVLGTGVTQCPTDVLAGNTPPQPSATWLDSAGVFCLGRSSGQIQRVTQGRFAASTGGTTYGSSVYRESQGLRQFVIGLTDAVIPDVTDVVVAETQDNGLVGA